MSAKPSKHPRAPQRARKRLQPQKSPEPVANNILEGAVLRVHGNGTAQVRLENGTRVAARLPQHVSASWLEEAVRVGPVDAAVALLPRGRAILWCIFPGPEHAAVQVDLELSGRKVAIHAEEGVEIQCSHGRIQLSEEGDVTVRGREVLSRASGVHRIKGGTIRLN